VTVLVLTMVARSWRGARPRAAPKRQPTLCAPN